MVLSFWCQSVAFYIPLAKFLTVCPLEMLRFELTFLQFCAHEMIFFFKKKSHLTLWMANDAMEFDLRLALPERNKGVRIMKGSSFNISR